MSVKSAKTFIVVGIALAAFAAGILAGIHIKSQSCTDTVCCEQKTSEVPCDKNKTNPMIRLNVFIQTTDANRTELISKGRELVAGSLSDKGCIAYDLFESATRPNVLMICETWQDQEALTAHQQAPHFTTLVPRIHELGEMKLERFEF